MFDIGSGAAGMSGLDLQREIAGGDAPAFVFGARHGAVPILCLCHEGGSR